MKPCTASWCRLVFRCLCAVPSVMGLDATGIRCAFPAKAKAWSRPSTRFMCGYHHGCGRERLWRCRYTTSGFIMSLCVCTSASRGEELGGEAFYEVLRHHYPALCPRVIFLAGDTMHGASLAFLEACGQPWL